MNKLNSVHLIASSFCLFNTASAVDISDFSVDIDFLHPNYFVRIFDGTSMIRTQLQVHLPDKIINREPVYRHDLHHLTRRLKDLNTIDYTRILEFFCFPLNDL